ncbi:hypothetical protein [Ruthenibacterium lactatiformans]|uniref:hypothetical protein n=1 Tax=Ruthenibacterium lactatiformans TaxID=1550024 RepID=UPI003AB5C86B
MPRKSGRGISLRETTLCGCPLRGHDFATPHQYFAVPVTALPRRVPNGKNPALVAVRLHFASGETALAGYRPHLLGLPRKSGRGISLRETTLADVLACPVYRTENALFCSCRVFQYLTMQVKAPFY